MYPEDSPPEPASEDCLYLNVWARAGAAAGAKLPVMVWVYGGGLVNGSASTPLYAGDNLARRGVIVVTFNYRLGAFGFLAHPALTAESPDNVSGKYGHLDQLAALGWVKRNIASFGGDPENVTIFGQSSGSISISTLTASPMATGLFRRAIGESGALLEPIDVSPEFKLPGAENVGVAFANRLGASTIEEMRSMPAEKILAQRYSPQAVIDGRLLTETPFDAIANGRANDVDILVGSNEQEGLYFISGREITAANYADELKRDFPAFIVSLIAPKNPADDEAARNAFIAFEGDMRFGWNMWAWARLAGAKVKGRTYFYRFARTAPGEEGASHGAEMRYVFDHLGLEPRDWTDKDHALAGKIADYWTNFAKTGDPNGEELPEWPQAAATELRVMRFDEDARAGAFEDDAGLKAIDRLYATVRFALHYGVYVAAALAGLLLLLLIWMVKAIMRAFRR